MLFLNGCWFGCTAWKGENEHCGDARWCFNLVGVIVVNGSAGLVSECGWSVLQSAVAMMCLLHGAFERSRLNNTGITGNPDFLSPLSHHTTHWEFWYFRVCTWRRRQPRLVRWWWNQRGRQRRQSVCCCFHSYVISFLSSSVRCSEKLSLPDSADTSVWCKEVQPPGKAQIGLITSNCGGITSDN